MKPRGLLMVEHRLIERMIRVIAREVGLIEQTGDVDPGFIDTAVDFIRTYADRTHHGKEEDILFRELEDRPLSAADRAAMADLVRDHERARRATRSVVEAADRCRGGDPTAVQEVARHLKWLVDFYPRHIAREDKDFFPAVQVYFTESEDAAMLAEFWDFDRRMIHEKYRTVAERLEAREGR